MRPRHALWSHLSDGGAKCSSRIRGLAKRAPAIGKCLLQGGCLLAVGTFISTTTRSQIVAGVATFAVCLLLWVLDWVSAYETAGWAKAVSYMSVLTHFEPFSKGVIDTKDVVYYLSMIFLGLFLTARSMESIRWRA